MLNDEILDIGRRAVEKGGLRRMRKKLGLTRNAVAEVLYTSPVTYRTWEDATVQFIRKPTLEKVGRFMIHAEKQLDVLKEYDINIRKLMPMHEVAAQLGVPHEVLLKRYREGLFTAEDLGILGLWIHRIDLSTVGNIVYTT